MTHHQSSDLIIKIIFFKKKKTTKSFGKCAILTKCLKYIYKGYLVKFVMLLKFS